MMGSAVTWLLLAACAFALRASEDDSLNDLGATNWKKEGWPRREVTYRMEKAVGCPDSLMCKTLLKAILRLEAATCVRFRPWSGHEFGLVFDVEGESKECVVPPVRALRMLLPEAPWRRAMVAYLGSDCLHPGLLLYKLARAVAPLAPLIPLESDPALLTQEENSLSEKEATFINDFYQCETKRASAADDAGEGTCSTLEGDDCDSAALKRERANGLSLVVKELSDPRPVVAKSIEFPGSGVHGSTRCLKVGWAVYGSVPSYNVSVYRESMGQAEEQKARDLLLWASGPLTPRPTEPAYPQHLAHIFIDVPDTTPFQVRLEYAMDWGVLALEGPVELADRPCRDSVIVTPIDDDPEEESPDESAF